jgi:hypothetical protein
MCNILSPDPFIIAVYSFITLSCVISFLNALAWTDWNKHAINDAAGGLRAVYCQKYSTVGIVTGNRLDYRGVTVEVTVG